VEIAKCLSEEHIQGSKKYYLVPLKLQVENESDKKRIQQMRETEYAPLDSKKPQYGKISYVVDKKLLIKVARLRDNGYRHEQDSILPWL